MNQKNKKKEEETKLFPETQTKFNNDTLQILLQAVLCLYLTFISIYEYITTINLPKINKRFIISIILLCLLSFVYAFQTTQNKEITDSLLLSAYYYNMKTNRISYDEISASNNSYTDLPIQDTVDIISTYYNDLYDKGEKFDFPFLKDMKNNQDNINKNDHNFPNHSKLARNIYKLYGNKTIFRLDIEDLEIMVSHSIISERQAVFLWEILLQDKIEKARNAQNSYYNRKNNEIYLMNFFPIKGGIFASLSFIVIYFFLLKTYSLSIKNSLVFNIIGIIVVYFLTLFLYMQKFMMSSSLLFIQLIYFIKCFLDSIALWLGYSRDDFEIFSSNLSAKNVSQFVLRFLILFILTIITGELSMRRFQFFFNYIIFYLTLFTLFVFISNCFESNSPQMFRPLKNVIIVSLGIFNFIISKCHNSLSNFSTQSDFANLVPIIPNSLYFISDVFTGSCFNYLGGFLFFQIKSMYDKQAHPSKIFAKDDLLWVLAFIMGIGILIVGIIKREYMCYLISLYVMKTIIFYFSKIFHIKLVRFIDNIIMTLYISANYYITSQKDEYLTNLFIGIGSENNIIFYLVKILGLFQILVFILMNFDFVYSGFSDKNGGLEEITKEAEAILRKVEIVTRIEKKKNKKFKSLQIQVIRPEKKFNFISICYVNTDFIWNYFNICIIFDILLYYEKNYICLILYIVLLFIFFVRVFFIVIEFKNDYEYLYSYLISLILSLRLLALTKNISIILYLLCHINVICLILLYCLIERRKNIVTCFIVLHLYAGCIILNSNFLFIDLVTVLCVPISFGFMHNNSSENNEDKGNSNGCSCAFLIPALIVLGFQLYGFKNVYYWMLMINAKFKKIFFGFDIVSIFITLDEGKEYNELSIIRALLGLN